MAKITRATAKIFGSTAGANQRSVFGSLAAAAPAFSTAVATIQSLSNWLEGWFGAVVGGNSPAIEDMNSFCFVMAYQIAYLMQAGVAEWDAGTTYYIGSLAQDGAGVIYISLADNNTNHALSNATYWKTQTSFIKTIDPNATPIYTVLSTDSGSIFLITSNTGACQFNLPAPSANFSFRVKDIGANFATNNFTFHRNGTEKIQLVASDYVGQANGGEWLINSDGTDWFFVGR